MTQFMIFLKALPIIWKFWGELKVLFVKIGEMKDEWEAKQFVKDLNKASEQADTTGDTSGYEDIIRRGKK
jgi:hypothetical protein